MSSTTLTVSELKKNNQDFEYYPTTQQMVDDLFKEIKKINSDGYSIFKNNNQDLESLSWREQEYFSRSLTMPDSILDIGCGQGDFFDKIDADKYFGGKIKKYGIEKSAILSKKLIGSNIIFLGSDFFEMSLINISVDMIFSNPPYSIYEMWTEKIINEANSNWIALIIPERWRNSKKLQSVIENGRYNVVSVLEGYDFLDAERQARANVNIVIMHTKPKLKSNAFDDWFYQTFPKMKEKTKDLTDSENKNNINSMLNNSEIIQGNDIAEQLVSLYHYECQHLFNNYQKLEHLDFTIFKELNIDVPSLINSLKTRIEGLKIKYWNEIFDKYSHITKRLTRTYQKSILSTISDNKGLDFTLSNIQTVTLWVIENSARLLDNQILDVYKNLTNEKSLLRYKSNKRFSDDDWKYLKEKVFCEGKSSWESNKSRYAIEKDLHLLTNYQLDYRIVVDNGYSCYNSYSWECNKLNESTQNFLNDIIVIANNIGFNVPNIADFLYNSKNEVRFNNFNITYSDDSIFANVKCHKNGNIHFKFDKEFMKRLNLEVARISGWVNSKKEASEELGISEKEINEIWDCGYKLLVTDNPMKLLEY